MDISNLKSGKEHLGILDEDTKDMLTKELDKPFNIYANLWMNLGEQIKEKYKKLAKKDIHNKEEYYKHLKKKRRTNLQH